MNPQYAGFLLPDSVLSSPWFIVLTTAVAFNTIIYLGLTLAKLIPWPHQFHPDNIRRILRRGIDDAPTEGTMKFPADYQRPESDDPYLATRLRMTRTGVQQGFALIGGLILMLSILTLVFLPAANWVEHMCTFATGALFLGLGLISTHRAAKTFTLIVLWSIASLLLSALMLWLTFRGENAATLAYLLVILVALPQITLNWRVFTLVSAVMFIMIVVGTESLITEYDVQWIFAGVSALVTGAILMRMRIFSLTSIVEQTLRADFVASTDPLTEVLSRQGIATLLPGLGSLAQRNNQMVALAFVDIDDLERINSEYGLNYGDDVLRTVARSISDAVRNSDYVSRWDGDAFLVAGMANQIPPAELFKTRIEKSIQASGVNLGKWPTTVTVRTTAGEPSITTFDELLVQLLHT